MECWKIGMMGLKKPRQSGDYFFLIPNIPAFHYSIIPYGSLKKRPPKIQ